MAVPPEFGSTATFPHRATHSNYHPGIARSAISGTQGHHLRLVLHSGYRLSRCPPPAIASATARIAGIHRDVMERLLVDRVDRHLRRANRPGSSSVPTLRITAGEPGGRVIRCVPQSAQNSRVTGLVEILARESLRRALGVAEALGRHQQNMFGARPRCTGTRGSGTAPSIPARPRHVPQRSAIAPAFELHLGVLQVFAGRGDRGHACHSDARDRHAQSTSAMKGNSQRRTSFSPPPASNYGGAMPPAEVKGGCTCRSVLVSSILRRPKSRAIPNPHPGTGSRASRSAGLTGTLGRVPRIASHKHHPREGGDPCSLRNEAPRSVAGKPACAGIDD